MRRHPLDLASLLAGLVLLGFAATYLFAQAAGAEIDATWVVPMGLVALGLAGLAGGLVRVTSQNGTDPASASTASAAAEEAASVEE